MLPYLARVHALVLQQARLLGIGLSAAIDIAYPTGRRCAGAGGGTGNDGRQRRRRRRGRVGHLYVEVLNEPFFCYSQDTLRRAGLGSYKCLRHAVVSWGCTTSRTN